MTKDNDITEQILIALRVITRSIALHSKKLLQVCGLTGPQLITLKKIAQHKNVTTGVLSKEVNLSQPTMTSILDRLEKKDYVNRKRDTIDKRKVYVTITDLGYEVISKAPSLLQEEFVENIGKLKDWEQTLILSTLQRVGSMMGARDDQESASPMLLNSLDI